MARSETVCSLDPRQDTDAKDSEESGPGTVDSTAQAEVAAAAGCVRAASASASASFRFPTFGGVALLRRIPKSISSDPRTDHPH